MNNSTPEGLFILYRFKDKRINRYIQSWLEKYWKRINLMDKGNFAVIQAIILPKNPVPSGLMVIFSTKN
jgi:hypothetical protein